MTFLTPIWLLALLPWTALVAWSLTRRRRTVAVPFVNFWPVGAAPSKRHGPQRPPVAVILLLASLLSAILAAGGLSWRGGPEKRASVTLIVDRGATMSVGDRITPTLADVRGALTERGFSVRVLAVPAPATTSGVAIAPCAVDTSQMLNAAIAVERRERPAIPVVVVTDQALSATWEADSRVVRVAPSIRPPARIAITLMAAEPVGASGGQVMLRLRNEGITESETPLTLTSGGRTTDRSIRVPPAGEARDVFVDLPLIGETIEARLGGGLLGERAYLSRRSAWPRVEVVGGAVPPDVARAVAAYGRARPASDGSARVTVASGGQVPVGHDGPAVMVGAGDVIDVAAGTPQVVFDALTTDIDWDALVGGGVAIHGRPPAGFASLVTKGDVTILAATPTGDAPRRAWVGLSTATSAQGAEWVMMWTRLFDVLGAGGPTRYEAAPPVALGNGWRSTGGDVPAGTEVGLWPGVYRHDDGRALAVNAPDVTPTGGLADAKWVDGVVTLARPRGDVALAPALLLTALACVVAAIVALASAGRTAA